MSVQFRGQRQERRGRGRAAADAGGLPAPPSAADRHPCRLRARRVRRLHRDRRRRGGALVPDARRAGRGHRDRDRRGAVQRRRPHAAAEVVPQASRAAMRLLHAGHDHDGACAAERGAGLRRRRACARCSPAISAAAPATFPSSRPCSTRARPMAIKTTLEIVRESTDENGQLAHRQRDRTPRGPALPARPRRNMSTISRARTCCTRRSCAARSPTAASARSTFRPPARFPACMP